MTKAKALEVLREVRGYTLPTGLLIKLDAAIAALEAEPLAVVEGWINKDDPLHLQEDLKLTPHVPHQLHISGLRGDRGIAYRTRVQMDTPVTVTIEARDDS